MQHALRVILDLLVGLFDLLVTAIAVIEQFVRQALGRIGVDGPPQTVILVLLLIALIIAAFRLFGRIFAVLIGVALLLVLLHALLSGTSTMNT